MKYIVLLVSFVVLTALNAGWSQEWRDSLNHARNLYKSGKYKEALKYYKSAERLAPNDVDLSEEKGQSAYRAGDFKEAESSFRRAASLQNDKKRKSGAYNNLGSARMKQENYSGAEEAFKEALRLDPSNEKIRQNLAEAKRLKKKKEEEEQKQKQNNDPSQDEQQQNNNQQQQQGNNSQQDKQQQQQSQSGQNNKNNNQQQQSGADKQKSQQQSSGSQSKEQKLADKQTERKLNELMRQEMDAKKRLDGSKGKSNGTKAKKDW